jgi:isoquinoline 1-oxidoreductase beta subunit
MDEQSHSAPSRRRFLGYLVAAPTLAVAVGLAEGVPAARASVPSPPQPEQVFDLGDMQDLAAAPTSGLITVVIGTDGTATFAVPRAEVGQGMTTAITMMVAEELDIPLSQVTVTLADARPELLFNQLTGGSNSMRSMYLPVRTAAAIARQQLLEAAATRWGVGAEDLSTADGSVTDNQGNTATYGSLAIAAAAVETTAVTVTLKDPSQFTVLGTGQGRIDARDAVTGRKQFTMDLRVPGALPAMVARPPTVGGTVVSLNNGAAVLAMPGVTDVAVLPHGVAIRAATFGQCIDAIQAVDVTWGPGPVNGQSDATVEAALRAAAPALAPAAPLTDSVTGTFFFAFNSNAPLEPDCAIADVTADGAEIWSPLKAPIVAQGEIAQALGLPQSSVTVHVTQGGGSFGRHLFHDAALEAALASQAMGKPVKLSWSRTDTFRQGRTHPMSVSQVRATYLLGQVLTYEQLHTSVQTSFGHGFGDMVTATIAQLPVAGGLTLSQTIFDLTQSSPYNFGVTTQALNEVDLAFSTGSMRNIYSPNVVCAQELIVDQLAAAMGQDRVAFRRSYLKDSRILSALNAAASAGNWGRAMPSGTAQGIAVHSEYQAAIAVLAEIDCTPATVNRAITDGVGGPRVTKVVVAVDPVFAINPTGLEAQMIGGVEDGIALALTSSLHMSAGLPQEGSWDNYFYTREWNVPADIQVIILPATGTSPSGAGELSVAPTLAAVACAYGKATGTMPTRFPVNHDGPLGFTPLPTEPSTPQSPTNGLSDTW